jgi:hypothetical protein
LISRNLNSKTYKKLVPEEIKNQGQKEIVRITYSNNDFVYFEISTRYSLDKISLKNDESIIPYIFKYKKNKILSKEYNVFYLEIEKTKAEKASFFINKKRKYIYNKKNKKSSLETINKSSMILLVDNEIGYSKIIYEIFFFFMSNGYKNVFLATKNVDNIDSVSSNIMDIEKINTLSPNLVIGISHSFFFNIQNPKVNNFIKILILKNNFLNNKNILETNSFAD